MVVSIKDAFKLIGVSVICCCAVLVCTMFLNYNADLQSIENLIDSAPARAMYDAQVLTSKVTVLVTGFCLLATSIVTLLFYVKHFIDTHKKDLGILKALGYSEIRIASNFWTFGLSVLLGTAVGFGLAYAICPRLYALQNADGLFPTIPLRFHGELLALLVILPTVVFAGIAILYAYFKIKQPVLGLLKDGIAAYKVHKKAKENKDKEIPFLKGLTFSILKSKKALPFFIWFACFCFSAMVQMSASMKDLSSEMMGAMMMIIGLTLACTTLIIAITTVIKGSAKTIALMRAFGYTQSQCAVAVLGGYRPFAYVGFAVGTAYQYGLLKMMTALVFKDVANMPDYTFDWKVMLITLAVFAVLYEGIMLLCAERIRRMPIKQIMIE